MNKLLIDTNVVLDLLAMRLPHYYGAAQIFSLADRNQLKLTVSALTFANTHYILSRLKSSRETRDILRRFKILVSVLSLNDKIIDLALNDDHFTDFEDALQYYTAIDNKQDIIITRNLKDFKTSKIPVQTTDEYLASRNQ